MKNNALVNKKTPFILNHAWIVVVFDVWEMNQFHHGNCSIAGQQCVHHFILKSIEHITRVKKKRKIGIASNSVALSVSQIIALQ